MQFPAKENFITTTSQKNHIIMIFSTLSHVELCHKLKNIETNSVQVINNRHMYVYNTDSRWRVKSDMNANEMQTKLRQTHSMYSVAAGKLYFTKNHNTSTKQ